MSASCDLHLVSSSLVTLLASQRREVVKATGLLYAANAFENLRTLIVAQIIFACVVNLEEQQKVDVTPLALISRHI